MRQEKRKQTRKLISKMGQQMFFLELKKRQSEGSNLIKAATQQPQEDRDPDLELWLQIQAAAFCPRVQRTTLSWLSLDGSASQAPTVLPRLFMWHPSTPPTQGLFTSRSLGSSHRQGSITIFVLRISKYPSPVQLLHFHRCLTATKSQLLLLPDKPVHPQTPSVRS